MLPIRFRSYSETEAVAKGFPAPMAEQSRNGTQRKTECSMDLGRLGIQCVFVTCFTYDFAFYGTLLRYSDIQLHRAETIDQADFLLTATGGTVLLSDVVFLDGSWDDAVDMLIHVHPFVASIVVASEVDRQFVSQAPNRGVCGILWKPFQLGQLTRLIRAADESARARGIRQYLQSPA